MSGLTSRVGAIAEAVPEVGWMATPTPGLVVLGRRGAALYAPFESGPRQRRCSFAWDAGGQYTNLLFQSRQLSLDGQFDAVKIAYAAANRLGDIPKVTPSSRSSATSPSSWSPTSWEEDVDTEQWVGKLPDSVVDYLKGGLGTPPGGFPEPLRAHVLKARGVEALQGRPGLSMEPYDFEQAAKDLSEKFEGASYHIDEKDVSEAVPLRVCGLHGAPTGVRRRRALTYSSSCGRWLK